MPTLTIPNLVAVRQKDVRLAEALKKIQDNHNLALEAIQSYINENVTLKAGAKPINLTK